MPRRATVVGLDDPPPSPPPPDGAAVARERVAQVVGTPRVSAVGFDDDASPPSSRPSSDGGDSTRPLSGDGAGGHTAVVEDSTKEGADASTAPLTAGTAASLEVSAAPAPPGRHCDPFSWREFAWMCGPGLLMAVAYLDPGNLEADIQVRGGKKEDGGSEEREKAFF